MVIITFCRRVRPFVSFLISKYLLNSMDPAAIIDSTIALSKNALAIVVALKFKIGLKDIYRLTTLKKKLFKKVRQKTFTGNSCRMFV